MKMPEKTISWIEARAYPMTARMRAPSSTPHTIMAISPAREPFSRLKWVSQQLKIQLPPFILHN